MSDKAGHPNGTANICWYCDIEINPATHQCPRFQVTPVPQMSLRDYIEKHGQLEAELQRTTAKLAQLKAALSVSAIDAAIDAVACRRAPEGHPNYLQERRDTLSQLQTLRGLIK